jgi:uncharacterized protein YlxP (DUF503 family)
MKYCLGLLTLELLIAENHSLKGRRSVMNSLKERIRSRFNVSVAEADVGDVWQRGGLIVSGAGASAASVEQALRGVLEIIDRDARVQVIAPQIRFYE